MAIGRDKSSIPSHKRRLNKLRRGARRRLQLESLEDRRVFASPQLVSINPNTGDVFNLSSTNVRNIAPRELTIRFDDGQIIDPASVTNTNFRITRTGFDGVFGQANDVIITPGFIGIGEASNEVVMRFAENLPDDIYRIDFIGAGATPIRNQAQEPFNNGTNRQVGFELELGAQVIAVVPQPVDRVGTNWTQRANQIDVYFNDKDLDPAKLTNPNYYRLIFTQDTVSNVGDTTFLPSIAPTYNATLNRVTLTFAAPLSSLSTGAGTYRLRIGTNEFTSSANKLPQTPLLVTPASDIGSSFGTADSTSFGSLTGQSKIVTSAIDSQFFPLNFPGTGDEPGHRDIQGVDPHLIAGADIVNGVTTIFYNFQSPYIGNQLNELANPGATVERQRIRDALDVWSKSLGVKFVESADQGITFARGDLSTVGGISVPGGARALYDPTLQLAVLDAAELDWNYDFGQNWFEASLNLVGQALGLGSTGDLPPTGVMGDEAALQFDNLPEPTYLGAHDIVHGQYVFRPDSKDIDVYKFTLQAQGTFTAETFAERLPESSSLDTVITIYRETLIDGKNVREMIARNDDYYSEDSFVKLDLSAGTYYVAVSSTGNTAFDPTVEDSGLGGTSQGNYQLRLDFRPQVTDTITDTAGVALDGDMDGTPGGVYNFWFRTASTSQTLFVDKAAPSGGTGTLAQPFNNIQAALAVAPFGSVVRILGNGGADNNLATVADTIPYEIGRNALGTPLADGVELDVPRGVTVMIDAGAVFKLRAGSIAVGSSGSSIDRSQGALQVLGTPQLSAYFTSYDDATIGVDTNPATTPAAGGNWGGIIFENDKDRADQRFDYERQGIFLNYVNHADIRYGGGQVLFDNQNQAIAPIHMIVARPTVTFNRISNSGSAAMSADQNSFEETNFNSPEYQLNQAFTSDYDRVGPDIYGNYIVGNSINGLFVRIATPFGGTTAEQTVAGRWDDYDIVHVLKENLVIQGTSGGGLQDLVRPTVDLVTLTPRNGGTLDNVAPNNTYVYRVTFVDQNGTESPPSLATRSITLSGSQRSVTINGLSPAGSQFRSRRIYRATFDTATNTEGVYSLVAEISPVGGQFIDTGATAGGSLNVNITTGIRGRLDASLVIDPSIVVKMDGARIQTGVGAQLIAEGRDGGEIIFTSIRDNRYGAGGTFNQIEPVTAQTPAQRGDWAGIYAGPTSSLSVDHAVFAYGGGIQRIGGTFVAYNVLEIHQADARVTNSTFEYNLDGQGGQGNIDRFGAGFNESAAIFIRGSQPIIVNNIIRNTGALNGLPVPALSINANSLNHFSVTDWGRSTGLIANYSQFGDNQGPLIRLNRMENNATLAGETTLTTTPSQINGMDIRGETLDTNSVWDDTDIVHVLQETIYVPDFHTYGGLRIQSSTTASLVVKLLGATAGLTATGRPLDINDRIGGNLAIIGQPSHPVIFTSLRDDRVGAGVRPDGRPQTDTNGDGAQTTGAAGDWRSIRIDQYAGDRNVAVLRELEVSDTRTSSPVSIRNTAYRWQLSASGTNTYYLQTSTGTNPLLGAKPGQVLVAGSVANEGFLGNLISGEWAYGDVDGLGYSTVYVRLPDGTDPDTKALDFVQYKAIVPGTNSSPTNGELLGTLATSEFSSDENLRLGFEVHGFLNSPSDVDVYSFIATSGTEVWLDIDRTSVSLDTVLELIDADGNVLARSNDSYYESVGLQALQGIGTVMQKTPPFNGLDNWTTNVRDAGMRVILPGPRNTVNTYHLRVRSNGGLTEGIYQLQVRLRETDEQPGSTVRYADMSFATNGVEVIGGPTHSPLLGEAAETNLANDIQAGAVGLGNLLNTDRAALSIAGALGKVGTADGLTLLGADRSDVDLYRFDVTPDSGAGNEFVATIFDIDTWKQNSAGNLQLWVFDSAGRLILTGNDSNVADDRPVSVNGNNNTDLTQGTVDEADPYVGVVNLPAGTYYVAVTISGNVPEQFATNPLLRLEPVNSIVRIAEDHIGFNGGGTADRPVVPVLVDNNSIIPYMLGDLVLYAVEERDSFAAESTRLLAINPFTGAVTAVINNTPNDSRTSFAYDVGDIAFRSDGSLFSLTKDNDDILIRKDSESGNYLMINTADGTVTNLGDDGIVTYEVDPAGLAANPPTIGPIVGNLGPGNTRYGYGVQFNAMTFAQLYLAERLYAVGNRGDSTAEGSPARANNVALKDNILYELNPQTGAAVFDPNTPTLVNGDRQNISSNAATDAVELGEILTAPRITTPDPTTLNAGSGATNFILNDGNLFTVSDGQNVYSFEFDAGFDIRQNINLQTGNTIRDGNFFLLDNNVFQFDTGPVISINVNGATLADGVVVTVNANGTALSWEFDNSDPNANPAIPPRDPNAELIPFGPGTTLVQLAGSLAALINAQNSVLGVTATSVGGRISLTGATTVAINHPLPNSTQVTLEGDTGAAPILHVIDPNALRDGDTFTIQQGPGVTYTFEFDRPGVPGPGGGVAGVTAGNIAVSAPAGSTAQQIAINIGTAVQTQQPRLTRQVAGDKVVINGQLISFGGSSNVAGLVNLVPVAQIPVEETFTSDQVGVATAARVNLFAPYQSGAEFARINFQNATTAEFTGVPVWTVQSSTPGVLPGSAQIQFLASDTPTQLAAKIAASINNALNPAIVATPSNQFVRLSQGTATVQAPLTSQGEGPGGIITGIAQVNGTIYAVSDNGGLYTVLPSGPTTYANPSVTTNYVTTSRDDLVGIRFTGLTAAPAQVENGAYANMLFATADVTVNNVTTTRLYAMNTAGQLQPIFVNGATSVQIRQQVRDPNIPVVNISNINGLAFSELQRNLWHVSGNRGTDVGHGINASYDLNRIADIQGGSSLYFGAEPTERNFNYNFNGGAQGSVVTNEFSLIGYAASDLPVMYFNFFSERAATLDSFKVFITGRAPGTGVGFTTDGEWLLLGTVAAATGGWQQARVDLSGFAGYDNLRIRFDFSTAGEMDVGETFNTGDELRGVDAKFLRDGDTFTLSNPNTTYEFDLGPTLILPSGQSIADGEAFVLVTGPAAAPIQTTFEFNSNGALVNSGAISVPFTSAQSADQVAQTLRTVIAGANLGAAITTHANGERLNIKGLTDDILQINAPGSFFSTVLIDGDVGVFGTNVLVNVNADMNRVQVASAIDAALETSLSAQRLVLSNGLNYNIDGQTFTLTNNNDPIAPVTVTFEIDSGYIVTVPAAAQLVDGDFFEVSDGLGNTQRYVFDVVQVPTNTPVVLPPGARLISVPANATQASVAQIVATQIGLGANATALRLAGTVLGNGRVQISSSVAPAAGAVYTFTSSNANITVSGTPGVTAGNTRVYVQPQVNFTATQVAANVAAAINANSAALQVTAVVDPLDPRRVRLDRNSVNLQYLALVPGATSISVQTVTNISKQHQDLLRIVGHNVVNAGPLALDVAEPGGVVWLEGDIKGVPIGSGPPTNRLGFNSADRGADNLHEGVYIDDIIIGFAEHGEMVTAAQPNFNFLSTINTPNVGALPEEIVFPYQLEIRRGQEYTDGNTLLRSFNTNARLTNGYSLVAPQGNQIADGQSFTVTDGTTTVRFEFDDDNSLIRTTPGSIPIRFDSTLSSDVIAQRIREAINSTAVQAILRVRAILSDGAGAGAFSNNSVVNLTEGGSAEIFLKRTAAASDIVISPVTLVPNAFFMQNALRDQLVLPGMTNLSNATYIGGPLSGALFSGTIAAGVTNGVVLATGDVSMANASNTSDATSGISEITAGTDGTLLEFAFDWIGGLVNWNLIFASDEFFDDVDAFGDAATVLMDGFPIEVALPPVVANDPSNEGNRLTGLGYDGYLRGNASTFVAAGRHTVTFIITDGGASAINGNDSSRDSALFIQAGTQTIPVPVIAPPTGIEGIVSRDYGDTNQFRDQGQIIISSNTIKDSLQFGIVSDSGARSRPDLAPLAGTLPHPGAARNLRDVNVERLAPGPVIVNNIIARGGSGGINFSGDASAAGTQQAPVIFGRIANNTIVGGATSAAAGVGISVNEGASPTLLNNIVANWATGVNIDATSGTTVVGGMLFKGNTVNVVNPSATPANLLGDFAITLAAADPLFVNPTADNYYLRSNSKAIDSSIESLNDRNSLVALRSPVGISPSPILAPDLDNLGQLRVDDTTVAPPSGLGQNVFKDRGAIDRVDFSGPTALLINPLDNGAVDSNPLATVVNTQGNYSNFSIQLADGIQPADPVNGVGVDDTTVLSNKLTIRRDGVLLALGTDYTFSYDATNNIIILTPLTGIWLGQSTYVITLDNSATGILDLAGNPLKANQLDQTTIFTINLGTNGTNPPTSTLDFGDAPDPRYPTTLASNGARHTIVPGFSLGPTIDGESNGLPTLNADGDGPDDDGVTFSTTQLVTGRNNIAITVNATEVGVLDAWIDFNGNGVWDTGEKVFSGRALVAGNNNLTFNVPTNAVPGVTYARFRLTKAGIALPTGLAPNGEVEDYRLTVIKNPWQNPTNVYDVSGDGIISPLDVLLIINRFNFDTNSTLPLLPPPVVPPYYDVDGNGQVDLTDAALVLQELNARPVAGSEPTGTSTFDASSATDDSAVASATGSTSVDTGSVAEPASSSDPFAALPGPAGESKESDDSEGFDFSTPSSFVPTQFANNVPQYQLAGSGVAADSGELDDLLDELAENMTGLSSDDFFNLLGQ